VITSKQVFEKRKAGAIDEAYQMALQLMGKSDPDEWDRKALGWCLIDIIKRDVQAGNRENLEYYRAQLEALAVAPDDDVLKRGVRNALVLCSTNGDSVKRASALSKEGRYGEAVAMYRKAAAQGPLDREVQTSLGWDLYKDSKQRLAVEHPDFGAVKSNLHSYLGLEVEKPSLLHACILQIASKLAGMEKLGMLRFAQLWNLKFLRDEEFERYRGEDGKEFPSLAEKVIQQAGKDAVVSGDSTGLEFILPHIDAAIERFPDNLWLKLDKAKALLSLGRHDDALTLGIAVAKQKMQEYWVWELLGDIVAASDPAAALGCYSKAMCCRADDKFTGKVRLKLALAMIDADDLAAAKYEVESVLRQKEQEGQRVPEVAARIRAQPWYGATLASDSNGGYYASHANAGESLLLSRMPWIAANVGETFTIPGMENKPKRRIYLKTSAEPVETSVPEGKLGRMKLACGDGLRVKGEFDEKERFQVYAVESRPESAPWDLFAERVGVVDHVNSDRGVLHFIIDREIDGLVPLSDLAVPIEAGGAIAVRISRYSSKKGTSYRVLHAAPTDAKPSPSVRKEFSSEVEVSNGMGFTSSDIFLSPPLIAEYRILDGQVVSGTAVLNFNKKRQSWGWKAVSPLRVERAAELG
jgi:tetratricopeptide (TPR) repeat protein